MPCYEYRGVRPVVDETAFVHPTATLIGDVVVGAGCLVGPSASLRGDIGRIIMEAGSNVQDSCTLHCFPGKRVLVEKNGHVGHGAVLHSATIKRGALVGMLSVVMDDAVIGEDSMIAALTFIKAEDQIPPRSLVAGIPGKVKRELSDDEVHWKSEGTKIYQDLAQQYLATFKEVEPLREVKPNRPELPRYDYMNKHET